MTQAAFSAKALSDIWPSATCPICGREFIKRRDWGCVTEDERGRQTLVCSIPCMRQAEDAWFRKRVEKAKTLRGVLAYRDFYHRHMTVPEIMERYGWKQKFLLHNNLKNVKTMYWKELEALEKEGWMNL